jgi:hypothetical protein
MELIQAMLTTKPKKQSTERHFGGLVGVVVSKRKANVQSDTRREYSVGRIRARGYSSSVFAQIMKTMKNGAVNVWTMTSHRFHVVGPDKGVAAGSCSGDCIMLVSIVMLS